MFKASSKIFSTIELAQWNRLRKSYAIIEVKDWETKQKFLSTDLRVFGILISGNQCIVEDADFKRSLILANIPYGEDMIAFVDAINQALQPSGIMIAKPKEKSFLMTRTRAILRLNNFQKVFECQKILHDSVMGQQQLKAHILHSNLKCFNGKYSEFLDFSEEKPYEAKLQGTRDQEIRYISKIEEAGGFINASEAEEIRQKSFGFKQNEDTEEIERQTLLDFEKAIQEIQGSGNQLVPDLEQLEESMVERLDREEDIEENLENTDKNY